MKLKVVALTALLLFPATSWLTSQEINAEVLRLNKLAVQRVKARDWDSAERHYLRALDIAAKTESRQTTATLHQNLGVLYVDENRFKDAEKQLRLSYELLKAEYGEEDPKVALALDRVGEVTCFQGNFAGARNLFQRSLSVLNVKSSKDPETARVLTDLASTEWVLGNLSKADKILGQATPLFEKAGREWQSQLAFALQVRALIAEQLGDSQNANTFSERALSIVEQLNNAQDLAAVLTTMGQRLIRQGDPQQAQVKLERALQVVRNDATEESAVGGAVMSTLAQCYHKQGRSREADGLFERAIGIDQRVLGPDHPNLLYAMRDYAQFLRATKRKKDAKRLEAYIQDHKSESARLNSQRDVVDFRQLLLEQKQ
jgi:tetratricopeptide (TPR) repeat protein